MSVQPIMEAPADPDAGARGPDVELQLTRALARATSADERGRLHDELARHYARRTRYRRMNRHETASVQAYAEGPDGAPLANALALHARAMAAFGERDDAQGRTLRRAARQLAIAHLPLDAAEPSRVTVADAITGAVLALERELGIAPEEDDEAEDVTYAHPLCEAEWAFQKAMYEDLWTQRVAPRRATDGAI